jgi:hypothetical protein
MDSRHRQRPFSQIIEGGQRKYRNGQMIGGADLLAWNWAAARGVPCTTVEADWADLSQPSARIITDRQGPRYEANAGPRRNAAMLTLQPEVVIAFPGGRGTNDMLRQARMAGVKTIVVTPTRSSHAPDHA